MILLVGFYQDPDARRQAELLECLERNVRNPCIDEIHVFIEDSVDPDTLAAAYPALQSPKIRRIGHGRRLTFRDLFGYANRHLANRQVAIANADIYFDVRLKRLEGYDLAGRLLCLSRWDVYPDGSVRLFDQPASQDAWIFAPPIREFPCDFHLGIMRCDNRLAWEADHAGLAVSNPARSIRAYHLHQSLVRRYDPRHVLAGPARFVAAECLPTPWLWFVVTCMHRLEELQPTLGSVLAQPRASCVLVDYASPDGAGDWVRVHAPEAFVTSIPGRTRPRSLEACASGAESVDDDGVICFLDAATAPGQHFSTHVLDQCADGTFLVPDQDTPTALVCRKADFERALAVEVPLASLVARLRQLGLAERTLPASLLTSSRGSHFSFDAPPVAPAPPARVAFREDMGYVVRRLALGTSSHTNDPRPFSSIPDPLLGLAFTQVVAGYVSPVEVEFLSPGTLYVLVGDDWQGALAARDWLLSRATRAELPPVQTERGSGFEVWSLAGAAGERFVIPTQVVLVAEALTPATADGARGAAACGERMVALTSLAPSQAEHSVELTRACISSWRCAGLEVRAFQHPDQIASLAGLYDVEFVPVATTPVPIDALLDWAIAHAGPVLLVSPDIRLQLAEWELKRLRWLCDDGLCCVTPFNEAGAPDPYSLDAFLFRGRHAAGLPASRLSLGQPFWDYWLPHAFATGGRPIRSVTFPAASRQFRAHAWSWSDWYRCALEFARLTGEPSGDESFEACAELAGRVRQAIAQRSIALDQRPFSIQDWVRHRFGQPGAKLFLELGSHQGGDTAWMAELPDVTIHAFEPDPRNSQPPRPNVIVNQAAIADRDGIGRLILSQMGWGQVWTCSSSIEQPKRHLARYPVTFGESVEVRLVRLDTYVQQHALGPIDFIWADIQGAEGELIRGGQQALSRTRYLYTEYADDELYAGQVTLAEIMQLLPDFRVLELWPDEVLLENTRFPPGV